MEKSSFFDAEESPSGEYDREYLAEDFASYFARFISNGVFPNPSTGLQVVASEEPDMSVTLQPGYAYINGYKYENTTPLKFEVDVADGLLERDEAIFIRFSRLDRNIKAYKIKGDPSVSAVTPEVTRTADYWDLCVGIIHVTAGIISIDQSLIEDTRLNTELCGIVTTLVTQVDTTTLYNQIQADLKKFQTVSYQEFADWFEDLKGKLGDDPATALQSQIDNIMDGTDVPNSGVSVYVHSKSGTVHEFTGAGPNGRALMTANVEVGDTFTVNGSPATAYVGAEDAVSSMAGSAWNGKWVTFVVDGGILNFKGGGGKVTVSGLSAAVVKTGTTVTVQQGAKTIQSVTGTFTSDANAAASQILSGKTAYVNGVKVTGTISSKDAATYTPKTTDQTIAAGQYLSGVQTIKGDAALVAKNVRKGVSLFGVVGTLEPADELDVLATMYYHTGDIATVTYWNGSSYATGAVQTGFGSVTVKGTVQKVMIFQTSGGNICGHSGVGTYTGGHTNTISGFDNKSQSFVVLGKK